MITASPQIFPGWLFFRLAAHVSFTAFLSEVFLPGIFHERHDLIILTVMPVFRGRDAVLLFKKP